MTWPREDQLYEQRVSSTSVNVSGSGTLRLTCHGYVESSSVRKLKFSKGPFSTSMLLSQSVSEKDFLEVLRDSKLNDLRLHLPSPVLPKVACIQGGGCHNL